MHTLLILPGYVVYFIVVVIYVSQTCDVNEYVSNANYRKYIFKQIDLSLTWGLIAAVVLFILL